MDGSTFLDLGLGVTREHVVKLVSNLSFALLLAAGIASRPWRRYLGIQPAIREMVQAQILIGLAGALVVTVIGDSVARAFGLVGLGGFIRFRTGIRDPRDAAVFFLIIGLGMACGLGAHGLALIGAIFVAAVTLALDLMGRGKEPSYLRLTATCTDALLASKIAREAIEAFPVTIRQASLKIEGKEIRFDIENPGGVEPARLQEAILARAEGRIVSFACESLETLRGSAL